MNFLFRIFAIATFSITLVGCATIKNSIDTSARPGDTAIAVVVGRVQVSHNGMELRKGATMIHVSPFVDAANVAKNPYVAGEFAIKVPLDRGGHFAVNLPPGKYYIVEFVFPHTTPRLPGFRTYMPILGNTVYRSSVLTFDVEPG
jgi:hypothetical protein